MYLQVWAGNPAKFLRKLTEEEIAFIIQSAANYVNLATVHAAENAKSFDEIELEKMLRKKFARRDEEYDSMIGVVRETPPELVLPDNILPGKSQNAVQWAVFSVGVLPLVIALSTFREQTLINCSRVLFWRIKTRSSGWDIFEHFIGSARLHPGFVSSMHDSEMLVFEMPNLQYEFGESNLSSKKMSYWLHNRSHFPGKSRSEQYFKTKETTNWRACGDW